MAQNLTVKPAYLNKVQVMIDGVLTLLTNNLTQAQLLAIWQKPEYNYLITIEYVNVQDSFPENFLIDPNLFNAYDSGQISHDKTKANYPVNTTGAALNEARGILDATNNSFVRSEFRPAILIDFANSKFFDPRNTYTRNSVGTYVDEQGKCRLANSNKPRFTHSLDTQRCNGLLIEPSRTNIFPNSEDISIYKSASANFDGYTTLAGFRAFKFTLTASSNSFVAKTITLNPNTTYTYSYLCSINNPAYIRLEKAGNVTSRALTPIAEPYSGVYKCSITFTTLADEITCAFHLGKVDVVGASFTVAAVQVEVSGFATSYIPTTSVTPVTRGIDKLTIPLGNLSSEFTLLVEADIKYNAEEVQFIDIRGADTAGWNCIRLLLTSTPGVFVIAIESNGVTQYYRPTSPMQLIGKGILVCRISNLKQSLYWNGNLIFSSTNVVTLPTNLSSIIASSGTIGTYLLQTLAYWNIAIPEADCLNLSLGTDKVTEFDLGRSAFIRPEAILRTLGRQEFSIDGTGASITRNIRRPYDFYFELVDTTGYTAMTSQPPVTLCSANTDYPLTVTLPVGKTLTYAIVPNFDN